MSEDEAVDILQNCIADYVIGEYCEKCGDRLVCANKNEDCCFQQAIGTILAELEKKDKIIDAMAEWIGDRCFYSDDYGNSCEIIQDSCCDTTKDCKDCIKQYFERRAEDE